MSKSAAVTAELDPTTPLEIKAQEAINLCGGNARAALRATLIANAFLRSDVDRLTAIVSTGFARRLAYSKCAYKCSAGSLASAPR
jgi:hypothetical protein